MRITLIFMLLFTATTLLSQNAKIDTLLSTKHEVLYETDNNINTVNVPDTFYFIYSVDSSDILLIQLDCVIDNYETNFVSLSTPTLYEWETGIFYLKYTGLVWRGAVDDVVYISQCRKKIIYNNILYYIDE